MCRSADLSPSLLATERDGLLFFRFRAAVEASGPRHAISTRLGGKSEGRTAHCNLSLVAGEPAETILANRLALGRATGIELDRWVSGRQVHGDSVARVGIGDCGRGARDAESRLPATDALVTSEPEVGLAVLGADCGLVLLWVPAGRGLAVAHAGWRGLAAGVLTKTVETLCSAASVEARALRAGVAPAVGACCYQVGTEVRDALSRAPGRLTRAFRRRRGSLWLDVEQACVLQLVSAGVPEAHIARAGVCTACHGELFYSARGDGEPTGRFALLAMLK